MSASTPIARSAGDPLDDLEGGLAVSPNEVLERLWHLFISMRFGLVLMLILALFTLAGTLLAQAPAGMRSDPQAYAAWLESIRPRYGGWTNVLETIGFLDIFDSLLFKGVTILLITSTVACSVNRAPLLWKQTTRPRMNVTDAFFAHAPHRATVETGEAVPAASERLVAAFRADGFRTLSETTPDGSVHVYADRFRWAPFGTVVAHLSLVLILVGAMVGSAFGFKNSDFVVPIGSTVDVGFGTGLAVEAKSFTDSYYDTGQPSDYASDLVVYENGTPVARQTVRVNEPLRQGDVTFYQSFFGPAMVVEVADASGTRLFGQGVPLRWSSNDGTERVGFFTLPDRDLTLYVYGVQSGERSAEIRAGQARVEVYRGDAQTFVEGRVVDQGVAATVGGLTVTFVREQQFTGLIAAKDPGVPFVWGGALALLLGVCVVFFFHNRRIWAVIHPAGSGSAVRIAAVVRHDVTYRQEFGQLIDDIQRGLGVGTRA
jgi:cytochrome c biogenesis protein